MSQIPIIPSVLQDEQQDRFTWFEFCAVFLILVSAVLAGNILFIMIFADAQEPSHKYRFEKIAAHVADDYEYSVHIFDCSEFSDELYNRLIYAGYEHVRVEGGCRPDKNNSALADYDACHAWVVITLGNEEIFIEATSGAIMSKPYYRKRFPHINHIVKSSEAIYYEGYHGG